MTNTTLAGRSLWFAALAVLAIQMASCSKTSEKDPTTQLQEIATEYSKTEFLYEDQLLSAAARVNKLKFSEKRLTTEAKSFVEALRVAATVAGEIKSKKQQFTDEGEAREMAAAKILRSKAKEVGRVIGEVTGSSG